MEISPLITIVTPSFNQGHFIEETIKSVLNQTYKNIQYIVVDGGSNDITMKVVDRYKDQIDIIIHEVDKGQSDAINKGFKLAKGELVGWINSDDLLYPRCVENIVKLYRTKPNGSIYYCSLLDQIDKFGNLIQTVRVNIPDLEHLKNQDYTLVQQGSFYKTELIKRVGYIDERIHYCMDLDLWLRLLQFGEIYAVSEKPYSAFRIWEGTKTTNGGLAFLKNIRYVLRRNNANILSNTIIRTYWYSVKLHLKSLISLN